MSTRSRTKSAGKGSSKKKKPAAVESKSLLERIPRDLRTIAIVLVIIAVGISAYMSYTQLDDSASLVCTEGGTFNCNTVEESPYAKMAGIPIALFGLATNLALLGILLLEDRIPLLQEYGITLFFLVVVLATLYSIYLIYLQAVVIEAFCIWCLAHEVVVFALLGVAGLRLRNYFADEFGD